jgi:hypothetical protein
VSDSVNIGGQPYTVGRFKSYKAVLVGSILSSVTKEIRQLFKEAAQFRREYRADNPLQITRQMCLERISEFEAAAAEDRRQAAEAEEDPRDGKPSKADLEARARIFEARAASWQRQFDDMGERGFIEVPQDPSEEEVALAVFPAAFRMRQELTQLLALLVTPDSELRDGWREDTIMELLRSRGEKLLEDSEPEELVQLALVAKGVVGDQFRPLAPALAKLLSRVSETTEEQEQETTETEEETTSSTTSTPESPTSSTGSPEPTGGTSSPSSLASPGAPLSPSPSA